ncbi:TRAP transporter substrate-binding protein DctP [Cloacibacillus evryensis]|uniref:TRAP transporter substrate-binding protein DctP n=2 Tax=Cloacibacillus evryensis TaxID=508460 RepID=UPI0026E040AF|nr:TRAP transporter substrate-binding protein DctP [Cloacibacillus evryensis]
MQKKKFSQYLLIIFVVLLALANMADASVKWKLSHHRPVGSTIDVDLKKFASDVGKATEGRVKIEVFPAAQLGGSEIVMERVGIGAIEMVLGYPTTTMDPRFDIYNVPALAKNYDELEKLFSHGSPFMNIIHGTFAKLDMHTLMSYCVSFVGLGLKHPVDGMLDADTKHKEKIRTATLNSFRYPAEAIGYLATPIPMNDLFTAIQTGIVDGSYGNGPEVVYLQFRDVIKSYIPIRAQSDIFFLVVNKDAFDGLDVKDQKIITDLANKFEKNRFKIAAQEENNWLKRLAEKGTKIHELNEKQVASFHKTIQDFSWPKLKKDIGEKFFNDAIKARDEALKK